MTLRGHRQRAGGPRTPSATALTDDDVAARLVRKDATLWGPEAERRRRSGWAGWTCRRPPGSWSSSSPSCAAELRPRASTASCCAAWAARRWRRRSSAGPPGCRWSSWTPPTPARCAAALTDLDRTVVVVSSKSGGTVETDSQRRAFLDRLRRRRAGREGRPGRASSSSPTPARRCRRPPRRWAPAPSSSPTRPSAAATARCRRSGWCPRRWPAPTSARCSTRPRSWPSTWPRRTTPRSSWAPRWARPPGQGRDKLALADGGLRQHHGLRRLGRAAHRRVHRQGGPRHPARRPRVGRRARRHRPRTRCSPSSAAGAPAAGTVARRHRPAGRPVPRLGVRHRRRRAGARHQPVRPAQRDREQGEHQPRSSPRACPTSRRRRRSARSRCAAAAGCSTASTSSAHDGVSLALDALLAADPARAATSR